MPNNCQVCSSRKITITFLGPHQKGGNLHHLFEKDLANGVRTSQQFGVTTPDQRHQSDPSKSNRRTPAANA